MSYSDVFHDYIQDIPMNVGRKFFPTPNIVIDDVFIPTGLDLPEFQYDFKAENRAREAFDQYNEEISSPKSIIQSQSVPEKDLSNPSTSISTVRSNSATTLSQDVLVPCPVSSPATAILSAPPDVKPQIPAHAFFDFESQNSVFDDVEISALDDKKALQEILMNSSSQSNEGSPLPIPNSSNNNNILKKEETVYPVQRSSKEEELRKRLVNKGYRSDIIETCMKKLPKSRFVHIEYYMKACRTMEKTGIVPIDDGLEFLMKCDLNDKQTVLQYSETCAGILPMGFPKHAVFEAVIAEKGDRDRCLRRLIPSG